MWLDRDTSSYLHLPVFSIPYQHVWRRVRLPTYCCHLVPCEGVSSKTHTKQNKAKDNICPCSTPAPDNSQPQNMVCCVCALLLHTHISSGMPHTHYHIHLCAALPPQDNRRAFSSCLLLPHCLPTCPYAFTTHTRTYSAPYFLSKTFYMPFYIYTFCFCCPLFSYTPLCLLPYLWLLQQHFILPCILCMGCTHFTLNSCSHSGWRLPLLTFAVSSAGDLACLLPSLPCM